VNFSRIFLKHFPLKQIGDCKNNFALQYLHLLSNLHQNQKYILLAVNARTSYLGQVIEIE